MRMIGQKIYWLWSRRCKT